MDLTTVSKFAKALRVHSAVLATADLHWHQMEDLALLTLLNLTVYVEAH